MKNRKKPDYRVLERKIYLKIALIALAALLSVFLIRLLVSGSMGNLIVDVLRGVFGMSTERAQSFYYAVIRRNLNYILFVTVAVFFVILARFLLGQFAKYFSEISDGLDVLVADAGGEITLSTEMAAMEQKLKAIRQTLTEREQALKAAEERKNEMLIYLAHDLRTPLTSVVGYLSLLHEAPDMDREQKAKYVDIGLDKARRLEKLVDEFFEIARYSLAGDAPKMARIDLAYMLAQMADEFYPLLSASGKTAVLAVPEDMVVWGDADRLARVFNNVLKNAIAYSPDGSTITIRAAVSGEVATISFVNPGQIPPSELSAIFDKFHRLDQARSTGTGGAGLGLAIAREIVTAHGGRIYAESSGGECVFTVELPVGRDDPGAPRGNL